MSTGAGRRFLVPETVQASAMDCGPAALASLLAGWRIDASYGRLREICQTSVDGTSIDTLEDVARQLGLSVEQVMVPADHVLLPEAGLLPGIVVIRLAHGLTHFVVAWRRHGSHVQVMDPATGRRWPSARRFREELLVHEMNVPADAWREWAGTPAFTSVLRQRMLAARVTARIADSLLGEALADATWRSLAALDAATRLVTNLAESGALRGGDSVGRVLERTVARARESAEDPAPSVPPPCWFVRPSDRDAAGALQLRMRGAVIVHARGLTDAAGAAETPAPAVPRDLRAALLEPPLRPAREILRLLREDGVATPAMLVSGIVLAAFGVVAQGLLFRSLLDAGRDLATTGGRLVALGAFLAFLLSLLLVEVPVALGLRRLGRGLETRLRAAFLEKIPRLPDRYFASRLNSDMAERAHSLHQVRDLPVLAGQVVRLCAQAFFLTAGLLWLAPGSAPLVLLTAIVAVGLPLLAQPALLERDLRTRSHSGALSRFYLDALLGVVPIRTHGAATAVRRAHAELLVEWARAALSRLRIEVQVEALTFLAGFGTATVLLMHHAARGEDPASALLIAWWALSLPSVGEELGQVLLQIPARRNVTLRLLEPLATPEEGGDAGATSDRAARPPAAPPPASAAAGLAFEGVRVVAGGHVILHGIDLAIRPGEHVAIVGESGAGKSSLLGLLLGWHQPVLGRILVDGAALDGKGLERLRAGTAWVDPAVQIWNRSLLENLRFGLEDAARGVGDVIRDAELPALLERLPDGLQTSLGEGGALVSGGEGQRVRLGRALARGRTRLVLLDEPFRGLDRDARRRLLAVARRHWKDATLLCVTHDVAETRDFDRVVVVQGGSLAEDGIPRDVEAAGGAYAALLAAEEDVRERLWRGPAWRRIRLAGGKLVEGGTA